jgi:hypothetical protein
MKENSDGLADVRAVLIPAAQIGSLIATGWLVWTASVAPRLAQEPLPQLIREALEYSLMAWQFGAAIAIALHMTMPKPLRGGMMRSAMATASTAVWFAPATILLSSFSPSTLAAALVLVISATRLLYAQWREIYGDPVWNAPAPLPKRSYEFPRFRPLFRELAPGLTVSTALEAGMLAILMGYPLLAAAFLALSAAMLTLFLMITGVTAPGHAASLPRAVLGVILTIILSAGLAVTGLSRRWGASPGWDLTARSRPGLIESTRALLRNVFYGDEPPADDAAPSFQQQSPPVTTAEYDADTFPGVILWPELQPQTRLIDPSPAFGSGPMSPGNPLSIPFSGQYWMYKPPYTRPPESSFFRRGTPVELSFKTTDHSVLRMEARQQLDRPIDTRCCRAIRITVLNADRQPGFVVLELFLLSGTRPFTLGRAALVSQPDTRTDPVTPAREELEFAIPASIPISNFDQWRVVFHRNVLRLDRSARVAIERFTLVPRS